MEYMRAFFDGTWDSFIAQVPRSIEGTDALLTFAKKHPKVCKGAGSEPIALLAVYVDHKRL